MKTKEFLSEKYRALVSEEGLLTVYNGPPVIRKTMYGPDGSVTLDWVTPETAQSGSEKRLLTYMSHAPVFQATWAGNRRWNVDLNCGAQRWNGTKTSGEVTKALANCMFDREQIKEIVLSCRKAGKQDYAPRHY
jgi:hypothetical protein